MENTGIIEIARVNRRNAMTNEPLNIIGIARRINKLDDFKLQTVAMIIDTMMYYEQIGLVVKTADEYIIYHDCN